MLIVLFGLVLFGCIMALVRWRWGILFAILVGLLQDPLRKMIPGAPSYLILVSAPIWLSAMASAAFHNPSWIHRFLNCFPRLGMWIQIFMAYLVIPATISATYGTNTWQITLLGIFVYTMAFLVLVGGWRYPNRSITVEGFFTFYVLLVAVLLIGGPLEAWGLGARFPAIGTEALGHLWVTYRTGSAVHMLSGFFRGPDVMGWHASLVFMISVIMAFRSRGSARIAWIGLAVWGVLNIWLCGRRKMLSMIPVFMGSYLFFVFRFKEFKRMVSIVCTVVLIGGLGWYFISSLYQDVAVEEFYLSAFTEVEGRLQAHGIQSVVSTVKQAGFWGYGLGMSQQGIHNIQAEKPRLWQESGPGKMVAELGVPGALLLLGLGAVLFLTAYHIVRFSRRDSSFYFTAGLFSILVANMTSAVVSAQIFGDPLIMLLLAFLTGLLLSGGRASSPPKAEAVSDEMKRLSPGNEV